MKTLIRGNVAAPSETKKDRYDRAYESLAVYEDRYEKHADGYKKTGRTVFRITVYNTEAMKEARKFPKGALVEIEGAYHVEKKGKAVKHYIKMYKGKQIQLKKAA